MIATHNIKVNGRWYRAGEEYKLPKENAAEEPVSVPDIPSVKVEEPEAEAPKEEAKPKTTSRRKKISG